jgi:alkanesulfonate monooxygenase SsuD/methylene tetrahydromethanopterin reductase-like flavin-dependent oxidoreductase (luciferase family)
LVVRKDKATVTTPRKRPLKVGLFLPFAEGMMDGATPRWADLQGMAQCAEAVGFDSIWLGDHLLFRFAEPIAWAQGAAVSGPWECWSLLAGLAAVTQRVELGPLVSCTSFRNPALLAKMATTVDEISNGRLILGLGAGWHEPEYNAFGYPFDHRVSRFAEALTIIHGLLRHGQIDFSGSYYQARDGELRPSGPRPGGIPLLIGGNGARVLQLAAQYADFTNAWLVGQDLAAALAPHQAGVDAACLAVGRAPQTLARTVTVEINVLGKEDGLFGKALSGSPAELAATLHGLAQAGIAHVQLALHPLRIAAIEAFAPVLALLDRNYSAVAAGVE